MKRFLLVSFAILSVTLSVGLFAPSSASASSDVDDVVRVVDELVLDNGTSTINISKDWLTRTEQALRDRGFNTSADRMMDTIGDPANSWGVIQNAENVIYVLWSTGKNTYFYFDPIYQVLRLSGQLCQTREMSINSELELVHSDLDVMCYDSTNVVWFGNNISSPGIFLLYYPITYPPGYAGSVIPETYTPPPEFQYTYSVVDKTITLYDISNLSLEQSDCYFQINPNGTQAYTELHFDCDNKQSVTHTVDDYGKYDLKLLYVTPDGLRSSKTHTIEIDGSTFTGEYGLATNQAFYKCLYSELPFIDFNECYNNVLIFTNLLSFNRLKFGTDLTPHHGCRNLVVLGGWINASTNTVCPMIPSYVRDVTTPFVTFLLGLLMMKFITSRGGGGFS